MSSNSISRPNVSGHPAMANIMKLAQDRAKLLQNKQKMDHDKLKVSLEARKNKLNIERIQAETEASKVSTSQQLKLMKAKQEAGQQGHDLKRKSFQLEKQQTKFKLSAAEKAAKLKQRNASAAGKKDVEDQSKLQPKKSRSSSQQRSPSRTVQRGAVRKSRKV